MIFYTDNCCSDRTILSKVFPSLKLGLHHFEQLEFTGETIVTHDPNVITSVLERMENNYCGFLGFDMEWEPDSKAALIQICDSTTCLIVQMLHLESPTLPEKLISFLENPSLFKFGVRIHNDVNKLARDFGIFMEGEIDLGDTEYFAHLRSRSLQNLTKIVLRKDLDKSPRLSTRWGDKHLSDSGVKYAAADAFAAFEIQRVISSGNPILVDIDIHQTIDEEEERYQRVLLDAYHFMDRYPVSKQHDLYSAFMSFLRDAIFQLCEEDVKAIKEVLMARNIPESEINDKIISLHITKGRIRRFIPKV